jgi:acyl carrier protein
MKDAFVEVRNILSSVLQKEEGQVGPGCRLIEDLGVDIVDLYTISSDCEAQFDIEIPDPVLDTFVTVGDVVRFVQSRISVSSPSSLTRMADSPSCLGAVD